MFFDKILNTVITLQVFNLDVFSRLINFLTFFNLFPTKDIILLSTGSIVLNNVFYMEISFLTFILCVVFLVILLKNNITNLKLVINFIILGLLLQMYILFLFLDFKLELTSSLVHEVYIEDITNIYYWNQFLVVNDFIIFAKLFICLISLCIFLSLYDYFNDEEFFSMEILVLMLFCIQGIFWLVSANDLFIIYLAVEVQSLSLYLLASLKKYSNLSIEAGLRYFILGSFASGLMLFGISLIYGYYGSTNFNDLILLNHAVLDANGSKPFLYNSVLKNFTFYSVNFINFSFWGGVGLIFMIGGLFFKLGVVPFHSWIMDVYEGSPLIITYFFSVLPKISFLIILIKLLYIVFFNYVLLWSIILVLGGTISILIGSIGALYQFKITRLIAYSAVTNMGYMILCLSLNTDYSIICTLYYLIIYTLLLINLFSILISIRRYPSRNRLKNLVEFVSVTHGNFLLSLLFVFCLLSLAGVPPLAGFFGKFFVFLMLVIKGQYFLGLYAVLFSVLTSVYYIS